MRSTGPWNAFIHAARWRRFLRSIGKYVPDVQVPGALPLIASAGVLLAAAVIASALPAARAARVDVVQALHSE